MTNIFRSVGIKDTNLVNVPATMQIIDNTMITSADMPDNVGVGDVVIWDDGSDQQAFIHDRTSSTEFTVKDKDGNMPRAVSAGQAFAIYRCYTTIATPEGDLENILITEP